MRGKRLTILGLSAMLALTTLAYTAPAVSADEGHPNIIVQAVIALEDIDAATSYYRKANLSVELMKDIRHWNANHGVQVGQVPGVPPFLGPIGAGACVDEYADWLVETRSLARVGFRYYRGKATRWQEFPNGDRAAARVRQMIIFDRVEGRQVDAQKAFLNCIFDEMPLRLRLLLF